MAVSAAQILSSVRAALPGAKIEIDEVGDSSEHYALRVIHDGFRGKSRVEQHQMVYQALKGVVGEKLHALSLQTIIPDENTQ
jgi:stress-induced morphogen